MSVLRIVVIAVILITAKFLNEIYAISHTAKEKSNNQARIAKL